MFVFRLRQVFAKAQLEDCLGLCLFALKMHNRQRRIMHLPFYVFIVKKGRRIRHITPSVHSYYTALIGAVTNQEPRKTIGYCFENNRLYCFPNPRWPPQISANQESNKEFKMAAPMKVGHVGKHPTSLNGGLESVSQISMATQITPGFSQKCHATSKST